MRIVVIRFNRPTRPENVDIGIKVYHGVATGIGTYTDRYSACEMLRIDTTLEELPIRSPVAYTVVDEVATSVAPLYSGVHKNYNLMLESSKIGFIKRDHEFVK